MSSYIQKKFSIAHNHKDFLENYKKLGFSGQSSIVREALSLFIKETARGHYKWWCDRSPASEDNSSHNGMEG